MKILFTHRYFWPDSPPYASMLRSLTQSVAKEGHEVHVFASLPSYRGLATDSALRREMDGPVRVRRGFVIGNERSGLVVRVVNSAAYCAGLFLHILKLQPDVVTAATFPPVFAAWTASFAAKITGAKFIYHMQDIHPEVSEISGGKMGKHVFRIPLKWLDNQSLRRADSVIVLSSDMAHTLVERPVSIKKLRVINNPPLERGIPGDVLPKDYCKKPGMVRLVFAGNLGRFQNLELLVAGIGECFPDNPDLELVLLGDGAAEPELKRIWGGNPQVKFFPFMPYSQAQELIKGADVGLVSLERGISQVSFPSKVSTYLDLGLPLLVLVEPTSELAKLVNDRKLGVVPRSMTTRSIADALRELLAGEKQMCEDALEWFAINWSASAYNSAWIQLLTEIQDNQETISECVKKENV